MITFAEPRQRNQPWTEADDACLRQMAGTHHIGTIATRLGRSRMSVESRARALKLTIRSARATLPSRRVR